MLCGFPSKALRTKPQAGVEMPAALVSFVQVTDCSVTVYHSMQNDYLPFF